jgi:hypothetical protein
MSDSSYGTVFGPSSPGALNLVSGQTHGADVDSLSTAFGADVIEETVIGDPQPRYDDCSSREVMGMTGVNVGDLLNVKGISWGFFQGGFKRLIFWGKLPFATDSFSETWEASLAELFAPLVPGRTARVRR